MNDFCKEIFYEQYYVSQVEDGWGTVKKPKWKCEDWLEDCFNKQSEIEST